MNKSLIASLSIVAACLLTTSGHADDANECPKGVPKGTTLRDLDKDEFKAQYNDVKEQRCYVADALRADAEDDPRTMGYSGWAAGALIGGVKLNLNIGRTDVDSNSDGADGIPVNLGDEKRTRGVVFGYLDKPFVKDVLGPVAHYMVEKEWIADYLAPEEESFQNIFFWDAFKVDATIGRQRVYEIQTDAAGVDTFNGSNETTTEWAFKYELDVGALVCAGLSTQWGGQGPWGHCPK